jgi:TRAP-type mannitol/chloroaromatic compound transport system permease large subunit
MSDPALGLTMLGLIVIAIMMGFPTAFTLMGMGMGFGYLAFWTPGQHWYDNQIFNLMVQRTYGIMTNDVLLSVPLFVFMGYIFERAALIDRMFFAVQLAFRRVPASLAVTTLLVCAFWGIASGIVGAVVILMGVIAMRPMLNAGYDVRLASGAITAGGTLGILIPPSVMLIVYAAVAGQSIVKLYAAAMLPGFFLTFLYLVYIVGWAILNPKIAPKLPPEKYRIAVPEWLRGLERGRSRSIIPGLIATALRPGRLRGTKMPDGHPMGYGLILKNLLTAVVPLALVVATFGTAWWYVVIYNAPAVVAAKGGPQPVTLPPSLEEPETPRELGAAGSVGETVETPRDADAPPQEMGFASAEPTAAESPDHVPAHFYIWFWGLAALSALLLGLYYWGMDGEQLEILRELVVSTVPLGVLTVVVLAVILLGITTATESAAIGALGALFLAVMARYPRQAWGWSLVGAIIGAALSFKQGSLVITLVSASIGGTFLGTLVPGIWNLRTSPALRRNLNESVFLTAKTTAMVCWLFIGSALFSGVFALHGGQALIERWVLGMDLSPVGFLIMAQAIIFFLGWPLEWTEIIVIFCPIFIPLLSHYQIDPILFGTMVAVNLQAAFLSPPVAMAAFYLKGVSPPHVTLNQIFAGMMPYMLIVILCLAFMYIWPGMTLWLPEFLYSR